MDCIVIKYKSCVAITPTQYILTEINTENNHEFVRQTMSTYYSYLLEAYKKIKNIPTAGAERKKQFHFMASALAL